MKKVLKLVVFAYVVACGYMYTFQENFMYKPEDFHASPADSEVPDMTEVALTSADGSKVFAWISPPPKPGKPWIGIFHGNAHSLSTRGHKARAFIDLGYGVVMAEYRGYGGNEGTPSEAGLVVDAQAALDHLAGIRETLGDQKNGLVLYGESLGSGVTTALAANAAAKGSPVSAVILEAPFTSTADVGLRSYPILPIHFLMNDHYDSYARITSIDAPLFIIHGKADEMVPFDLGQKLFAKAQGPKQSLWVDGAGHNDLFIPSAVKAFDGFIQTHVKGG